MQSTSLATSGRVTSSDGHSVATLEIHSLRWSESKSFATLGSVTSLKLLQYTIVPEKGWVTPPEVANNLRPHLATI